jgi:hypothetical protein
MPFHVARSAGLRFFIRHGPRYILKDDGNVVFTGHFDDDEKKWKNNHVVLSKIKAKLKKSAILTKTIFRKRSLKSSDVDLFIAIVDRARKIFEMRNLGNKFYVIYWDIYSEDYIQKVQKEILKGFYIKGIRVYLISDIMTHSDYYLKYRISPHDGHPNKIAHKIIADWVLTKILGQ